MYVYVISIHLQIYLFYIYIFILIIWPRVSGGRFIFLSWEKYKYIVFLARLENNPRTIVREAGVSGQLRTAPANPRTITASYGIEGLKGGP